MSNKLELPWYGKDEPIRIVAQVLSLLKRLYLPVDSYYLQKLPYVFVGINNTIN